MTLVLKLDLDMVKMYHHTKNRFYAGADPGFPLGGVDPFLGGIDLQHESFSVKMYVKIEELDAMWGGVLENFVCRSANAMSRHSKVIACTDRQTHIHYKNITFPHMCAVVDPGFPVGGAWTHWGVWTSNAGAFWQKHMQKQKNWVL